MFFVLYVEYAVRPVLFSLMKPLIQLLVLLGGIAISLTRISDYFHHWSDVLGGFIIGTVLAYYAVCVLIKLRQGDYIITTSESEKYSRLLSVF